MIETFSHAVVLWLSGLPQWLSVGMVGLFSFTEGVPVLGSLLPGGTIAVLAGSVSATGFIDPRIACAVIAIGGWLGDMAGFYMGRYLRHWRIVQRILESEKFKNSWDFFDRHVALIMIFGKLIPLVRSAPSLFAAARGISLRRYVIYSIIGSVLWGVIGIYAGHTLAKIFGDRAIVFIAGLVILSIVLVIVRSLVKQVTKKSL
jgi:membrane-associated protein